MKPKWKNPHVVSYGVPFVGRLHDVDIYLDSTLVRLAWGVGWKSWDGLDAQSFKDMPRRAAEGLWLPGHFAHIIRKKHMTPEKVAEVLVYANSLLQLHS